MCKLHPMDFAHIMLIINGIPPYLNLVFKLLSFFQTYYKGTCGSNNMATPIQAFLIIYVMQGWEFERCQDRICE